MFLQEFLEIKPFLEVVCAAAEPPPLGLIAAALDIDETRGLQHVWVSLVFILDSCALSYVHLCICQLWAILTDKLSEFLLLPQDNEASVVVKARHRSFVPWLTADSRMGREFYIDPAMFCGFRESNCDYRCGFWF